MEIGYGDVLLSSTDVKLLLQHYNEVKIIETLTLTGERLVLLRIAGGAFNIKSTT